METSQDFAGEAGCEARLKRGTPCVNMARYRSAAFGCVCGVHARADKAAKLLPLRPPNNEQLAPLLAARAAAEAAAVAAAAAKVAARGGKRAMLVLARYLCKKVGCRLEMIRYSHGDFSIVGARESAGPVRYLDGDGTCGYCGRAGTGDHARIEIGPVRHFRVYYEIGCYGPFFRQCGSMAVALAEAYFTLRAGQVDPGSSLGVLPRDVFDLMWHGHILPALVG
jgi:hypothetical protein